MGESFAIQGFTATDRIMCYVSGDDIIQTDYLGQQKAIGKTIAAYNELEATTTEYYNKLVELGVIVPPKSPEEQMAEMQRSMAGMADVIAALTAEIKELKTNGSEQHICRCKQDVPEHRPAARRIPGAGGNEGDTGQPTGRVADGTADGA